MKLLISDKEIGNKITSIAQALNKDFADKEVIIVAILKGAVCFLADLMRHLKFRFQIEFVKAESYGMQGERPGELRCFGIESLDLQNKNVLLLDDIFDTGNTLNFIGQEFLKQNPKTLKTIVLLRKKRVHSAQLPDYICFEIDDHFVVGYGLDYKEHYRGLKGIYTL